MNAEQVAASLGRHTRKSSGGFMAQCPAHDDRTPSLSLDDGDDGRVLFNCMAGCSQEAVFSALRDRGLLEGRSNPLPMPKKPARSEIWKPLQPVPADAPAPPERHYRYGAPTMRWEYRNQDGNLLGIVHRFDMDGGKQVLPLTFCANGTRREWRWQGFPEPRPLYGLERLGDFQHVIVVEGEKAADAARRLFGDKIVVVTWPGGSNAVAKTDWSPLSGRRVCYWPDADDPGTKAALSVVDELKKIDADVVVVEPPEDVSQGWDAADAEAEGWTKEKARKYLKGAISAGEYRQRHQVEDAAAPASDQEEPAEALEVVRGCDVKVEPVGWLWIGWLAIAKLMILAGAPGTGKTTLALWLAAVLTIGGKWPDGSQAPTAEVAIWSGEDDPADTLTPRLLAAGADLRRVHFIRAVNAGGERRPFDPSTDMPHLAAYLRKNRAIKLLIVDPVVSAVSGDSHKNTEVRRNLQPLVDLGGSCGCAVLGISHFSKGTAGRDPVERITGSIAFGALARIVLAAAKLADDEEGKRLFARAKSNIGPDTGGWHYQLETTELEAFPGVITSRIVWRGEVEGSARELLDTAETMEDGEERSAKGEAQAFLLSILADGPVPAKQVFADARGNGISERTLKRAKSALGVLAEKTGMGGGWQWSLPRRGPENAEEGQQNLMEPFGNVGPLRSETDLGQGVLELSADDFEEVI